MARPKKIMEGEEILDEEIPNENIEEIVKESVEIEKPTISHVALENILVKRNIDLYRDDKGHLENILIKDLEIDNYTFARLSLKDSVFADSKFIKCKFQGSDLTGMTIDNCTFDDCDLRWVSITKQQSESNMFMNCQERELNVIS